MSIKVIKLILVTDDDTAGMILDFDELPVKQRDNEQTRVRFKFIDKYDLDHELHFVHAEEV